ncbi:hypothetical protein JCM33374_g2920 [Metschnikowia sp. JCM 33374]|nr:hypothetical protein JCM33374_g2920 [Metschnikowia sp. JCM 33374]
MARSTEHCARESYKIMSRTGIISHCVILIGFSAHWQVSEILSSGVYFITKQGSRLGTSEPRSGAKAGARAPQ